MGTNAQKRARQRANRQAARADRPRGTNRSFTIGAVLVGILVVALVVWFFVGGGDTTEDTGAGTSGTGAGEDVESAIENDSAPGPAPTTAADPEALTACPPPERSPERYTSFEAPPTICIDPATTAYSAEVNTTEGSFTIALDAATAPRTVNNFVVLSRYRYYDGVPFHRVVPGFVIQAGDGDGTPDGSNDIGYTIDDELPGSADAYVDYSVAMANAGPDTGATQFFVVLPGGDAQLTNAYSLFGKVTEGTDVVDAIGELGGPDQAPTEEVLIEDVRIVEQPL